MAIIGKLREKSILVLIVVGLALVAFIITSYFGGGGAPEELDSTIGTVNGQGMDQGLYSKYESNAKNNLLNQKVQQAKTDAEKQAIYKSGLDQRGKDQASQQAFTFLSQKMLMEAEFNKLGLTLTDEEYEAHLYGGDEVEIHPYVQNSYYFRDSTGKFDANLIDQFLGSEDERYTDFIKEFEIELRETIVREKYFRLIALGAYSTKLEAKHTYKAESDKRNIRVVARKFSDVSKDIDITDEQLRAFYEEHKTEKSYEQKEGVELKFISLPVVAVEADFARVSDLMRAEMETFKSAENDSLFAMEYVGSDLGKLIRKGKLNYGNNKQVGTYGEDMDAAVQAAEVGDVVGPMQMNDNKGVTHFVSAKVQDLGLSQAAWVRHILIKAKEGDANFDSKKAFSDSLADVLRADKSKFDGFVTTYSEDGGSVKNKGEYKWFPEDQMVPTFNDFSFNGAIGEIKNVKTDYGFHIVEVLGRQERKNPIVYAISQEVKPSSASILEAENKAYEFKEKIFANPKDFDTIAKQMGLNPRAQLVYMERAKAPVFDKSAQGKGSIEGKVLNFALNKGTQVNDASRPLSMKDEMFVVMLSRKIKAGVPEFDDVKQRMKFKAINDLAAKQLIKEMSGFSNLNELAGKFGVEVKTAEVNFQTSNIPQVGNEPKVVGALFSNIKKGTITSPIEGNSGVYVVEIIDVVNAPETSDYSKQIEKLEESNKIDNVSLDAVNALLEKFKPVDDRARFRYGAK